MQFYPDDFIFHAISSRTSSLDPDISTPTSRSAGGYIKKRIEMAMKELLDERARLSTEAPFSPSVMEPSISPCPVLPVLPPPPCIGMVNDVTLLTDVCPIHHEIPTLNTAYRTQCNHFFDRDAIWMWWKIKGKKECPSCRAIEPSCPCISCKSQP